MKLRQFCGLVFIVLGLFSILGTIRLWGFYGNSPVVIAPQFILIVGVIVASLIIDGLESD